MGVSWTMRQNRLTRNFDLFNTCSSRMTMNLTVNALSYTLISKQTEYDIILEVSAYQAKMCSEI
jgi:hypothetical protein